VQGIVSAREQPALRTDMCKLEPQLTVVPPSVLASAYEDSAAFREVQSALRQPFDRATAQMCCWCRHSACRGGRQSKRSSGVSGAQLSEQPLP
jgi:hypothetical protein